MNHDVADILSNKCAIGKGIQVYLHPFAYCTLITAYL